MLTLDQAMAQVLCLKEREKLKSYTVEYQCDSCGDIKKMYGILYPNRFDTRPCESEGEALTTLAMWLQLESYKFEKKYGI